MTWPKKKNKHSLFVLLKKKKVRKKEQPNRKVDKDHE